MARRRAEAGTGVDVRAELAAYWRRWADRLADTHIASPYPERLVALERGEPVEVPGSALIPLLPLGDGLRARLEPYASYSVAADGAVTQTRPAPVP